MTRRFPKHQNTESRGRMWNQTIAVVLLAFVQLETSAQRFELRVATDEGEVPEHVVSGFKSRFTPEGKTTWAIITIQSLASDFNISSSASSGHTTFYEAGFMNAGKDNRAVFDHTGNWLCLKVPIDSAGLPDKVLSAIRRIGAHAEIIRAEKVTQSGAVHYRVLLKAGGSTQVVALRESGDQIKIN